MENKKLVEQILRLCEKQYRKGYQHGFMASENKSLSLKSVEKFRDRGTLQDYKVVEDPLNRRITRAIDRIDSELAMPDMNELIALLNEVYPFNYD